ncbi:hypothetical protein [Staphylococcus ratti]|uniref:Lipoprotein n=1 Tax=Staphylococcus ratti TaxID=2892440 RepID=A0ABY3PEV9_9STAP|nr:hypothetical protein [Staphylococcus ratti]UEX90873.1 hypothetical protein LN051_04445 [Staphylococcus ratti]
MKKVLFTLIACLFILSACGNDENKKDDKKSEPKQEQKDKNKKRSNENNEQNEKSNEVNNENTQEYNTQNNQQQNLQNQPVQQPNDNQANTNLNDDHVVSPGWTEQEQQAEYEKYKQGQKEQIENGIEPGAEVTN